MYRRLWKGLASSDYRSCQNDSPCDLTLWDGQLLPSPEVGSSRRWGEAADRGISRQITGFHIFPGGRTLFGEHILGMRACVWWADKTRVCSHEMNYDSCPSRAEEEVGWRYYGGIKSTEGGSRGGWMSQKKQETVTGDCWLFSHDCFLTLIK